MTSKKSASSNRSTSPASSRAPRSKKAGPPARAPRAAKPRAKAAAVVAPEGTAPTVVQAARVVTDEEIRVRAYFLSLEYRGDASDVDFWLLAERELRPDSNSAE